MSQPVKLSENLVLDARIVGRTMKRSIAGQVEFWASLGRAVEPLLRGDSILKLAENGNVKSLASCLEEVDSPKGRRRLKAHLEARPFPHYEAAPEHPGYLLRIDEDGSRTVGRFVNRKFQAAKAR